LTGYRSDHVSISSVLSDDDNAKVEQEDSDDDDDDDDDDVDDDDDDDNDTGGRGDNVLTEESCQASSQATVEPNREDQQPADTGGTVAPTDEQKNFAKVSPKELYRKEASTVV